MKLLNNVITYTQSTPDQLHYVHTDLSPIINFQLNLYIINSSYTVTFCIFLVFLI